MREIRTDTSAVDVVHVVVTYRRAGTEQVVLDLVAQGRQRGERVAVVIPPGPHLDGFANEARAAGASVTRIGPLFEQARSPLRNGHQLLAYFRATGAGVAHLHFPWAPTCFEAVVAAWLARVPIRIRTEHNPIMTALGPKQRLKLRILDRMVHRIVCVSHMNARRHIANASRPASKMRVVPNGIDIRPQSRADGDHPTRDDFAIPSDAVVAVMVGALEERKGVIEFVRSAAQAPGVWFAIVGDGPLAKEATVLARDLGVSDRMVHAGQQKDVRRLLTLFDIFVQPSHYEGLSIAMLEALWVGLPMVTTDVDGVADVVGSCGGAIVVPVGDVDALAAGINKLAADSELRQRFASVTKTRVARAFSAEAMYEGYAQIRAESGRGRRQ